MKLSHRLEVTFYEIRIDDGEGNWDSDSVGDMNEFATEQDAWDAVEELRRTVEDFGQVPLDRFDVRAFQENLDDVSPVRLHKLILILVQSAASITASWRMVPSHSSSCPAGGAVEPLTETQINSGIA
tara:strand:+ start:71 stop:451 length:381 start_codon:yes stop_codon:yes gene_type:complete